MFQYKIKVYNAIDDENVEAMGICFGEDFVQAMENFVKLLRTRFT